MSEAMNPVVGEPAMALYGPDSSSMGLRTWKMWTGVFFAPGRYVIRAALRELIKGASQDEPGMRWATLAELLAADLTEAEALPMLHHSQRPKGDGWIAWAGGECPIPDAGLGEFEMRMDNGSVVGSMQNRASFWAECWEHRQGAGWNHIIAYRLLKPMTATEVSSRQKPEEPDANADMVQRDLRPPTQREFGYAIRRMQNPDEQEEPPEAPELLIVAPLGQRVGHGMWGAGRE